MDEALLIDGTAVPVDVTSFRRVPRHSGSRGYTETGVTRTTWTGATRWDYVGVSMYETLAEAEALRDLLLEPGDHTVTGDLVNGTITCETVCGEIVPVDHRPNTGPTAMWRLDWRLIEAL